jgi:2',3'-cyclic-nucleotide 2'-phosphodiesterase (5'-nucleotidase family)
MLSTNLKCGAAFVTALVLFNCSSSQRQSSQAQQQSSVRPSVQARTLTILHTNDMHANFIPHEATWSKQTPKPMVGGFRELEFAVDSIRRTKPNVLLLDAGDVMTGNPITDLVHKGTEGGALFEMMNMIDYNAWCVGNHDFDISQENLIGLTKIAKFPTLSANLINVKNEFPVNNRDYIILERGGLRIGVFGLILQSLYTLVNQNNLVRVKVVDLEATAQKIIDKIDAQTDLIIALTHNGVSEDSVLAMNVRGLDIIVGGHSHTRLTKPKLVNSVIIVQAGRYCENLGELEVTVENDKVVSYNGKLVPLWANESRPTTRLSAMVDSIQAMIDKDFSEVIAELKEDWVRNSRGESNIGNWLADVQRDAAHAQVAFMNEGGIRTDVSAGPLTKRELFQVLPFRNILVTFQLTGKQLAEGVLHGLKNDDLLQLSGMRIQWRRKTDGTSEIVKMEVGGKPLDEKATYVCAASDYLVGQGKKYLGIEIPQPVFLKQTLFEVAVAAARKTKGLSSKVEGRVQQVN